MATTRIISSVKIDDYIPTADLCMRCHTEVAHTSTAHYGRIVANFQSVTEYGIDHSIYDGRVIQTPIVTEKFFPRKVTGYCCETCYLELWNTTWRDSKGDLRRAFERLNEPQRTEYDPLTRTNKPVITDPAYVDGALPTTAKLYAPHAGRGKDSGLVLTDKEASRQLKGFDRESNIRPTEIGPLRKKTLVKSGKWKVHPDQLADGLDKPVKPNNKP